MIWTLLACFALLIFSGLFSGSETGVYSVSRVKLRYQLDQHDKSKKNIRARLLNWLVSPVTPTIIAILIGNNLAAEILTSNIESLLHSDGITSIIITMIIVTPLLLIFAEFLPKYYFRRHANVIMYDVTWFLAALRILMVVPIFIASIFTRIVQYIIGGERTAIWEPHTSRLNLRTFLHSKDTGHDITPLQSQLVDRIMALERIDLRYSKVIKPITDVATLDASATLHAARTSLKAPYYARYVVVDHKAGLPIGYISAMTMLTGGDTDCIGDLAQPLPTLNEHTSVADALQRLHKEGVDLALVTNAADTPTSILFRSDCLRVLARLDD